VLYFLWCIVAHPDPQGSLSFWEAGPDLHQSLKPDPDRIRIKVKIQELWRLKVEQWMAVDARRSQ
jgi:hypothetical protein